MRDFISVIRDQFRGEVRLDEPMAAHTSLRIGGPVDMMAFPEDPLSLRNLLYAATERHIPLVIIGAGTNILVDDRGIRGIAVSLRGFAKIETVRGGNEKMAVLYAGAGSPLGKLLHFAGQKGYAGIETLAGIPGSVGGAVCMNAGSFGMEMKDVIESVAVMDRKGKINILRRKELNFSYRSANLPVGVLILSANIVLRKDDPGTVTKQTREFLEKKKETQPLGAPSAGCVFRNPQGQAAGRLIEEAGCKGMRAGAVEVSSVHANYFINTGKGTYKDFIKLMALVTSRVQGKSGIVLEPEIRIIHREAQE